MYALACFARGRIMFKFSIFKISKILVVSLCRCVVVSAVFCCWLLHVVVCVAFCVRVSYVDQGGQPKVWDILMYCWI